MKSFFSAIVILIASITCSAQDTLKVPAFVQLQHNKLFFGTDSTAFTRLFSKMDRLQADQLERLNIVHFGGSHVQAGIWSHTFASDLQYNFKTKGGGYFGFPYKLAKTNGQLYLSSFSSCSWKKCRAVSVDYCLPLGMSGLSVSTNDSAGNFGMVIKDKAACRFVNNVRVYHNFNSSYTFNIANILPDQFKRYDNLQHGYSLFSFTQPTDSFVFSFQRIDTLQRDFILYGFSLENDLTAGVYLAALGLNGASSSSFLRCSELNRQLPSLQADLYILSLGVNDTQALDFSKDIFKANYDSLINLIRSANPDAAIVLTTTSDNFIRKKTANKRTAIAQQAMFELAQKNNVAVWDLYDLMGGYRSIIKWGQLGLASHDRVHFTGRGYVVVGHLMYQALMNSYNNYKLANSSK